MEGVRFDPARQELAVGGARFRLPDGRLLDGPDLIKPDHTIAWRPKNHAERTVISPNGKLALRIYPHEARLVSRPTDATGTPFLEPVGVPLPYSIKDAAFSPDGQLIALAGRDDRGPQVWVYEPGHKHPVYRLYHESPVNAVTFSPDGAKLYTASQDGSIRRFSMRSGRQVPGMFHHTAPLTAIATTGFHIFGLAEDGTLRHWKALHPPSLKMPGPVRSLAFTSHDLVVGGDNYVVRAGKVLKTTFPVTQVEASDERTVARGEGNYAIWKGTTLENVGFSGFVEACLARDGTAAVLDSEGLRVFPLIGLPRTLHPGAEPGPLAMSADGQRLAEVSHGNLTLWEDGTPQTVKAQASQLALSADGKWLAQLGPATVWNVTMGKLTEDAALPLATSGPPAGQLEFSPNGQYLAARCWEGIQLWNNPWNEKARVLRTQTRDVAGRFAFSPDSRHLAWAGADGTFQLWDLNTGRRLLPWLPFLWSVRAVAFSPDGQWLALGCQEGTVNLLDLSAAEVPVELDTGCRLDDVGGLIEPLSLEEWQKLSEKQWPPHNLFEGRELPGWAKAFQ